MIIKRTGIHEVGILVGCLRKMMQWNFNSIVFEYRSFAGSKSRTTSEQFIESFDTDLVSLTHPMPSWFIAGLEGELDLAC